MISGWQVQGRERYEAEIFVCLVASVFVDTFLGTLQGSATANGLTRGSGEDQITNSEPSPHTRTSFEAELLRAGIRTLSFDSQLQTCRPTLGWAIPSVSSSITKVHVPELLRNVGVIPVAQTFRPSYRIAVVDPPPLEMLSEIQRQYSPFRGFETNEKRLCNI